MQFSDQVIKLLDDAGRRLGIIMDWSSENILPYMENLCGRIIRYEIITSVIDIVLSLALTAIGYIALKKAYKAHLKYDEVWSFVVLSVVVIILVIGVLNCLIGIPLRVYDIATASILPEKTILEVIGALQNG